MTLQLEKDRQCFVCGQDNPYGLKLNVERDGENRVKTTFFAHERYRGWSNYLHGGVFSLVFDELVGWLSVYAGYDSVTARLEVRYRNPVPLGSRLTFEGILEKRSKGLLDIRTFAYLEDGKVAAEGRGRAMIMNKDNRTGSESGSTHQDY